MTIEEIERAIRFFKEEKEQAQHAPDDFCLAVDLALESLQHEKGQYEVNQFLKNEYDCNCTQFEIVQMYIEHLTREEKSGQLKGFRILTNEDKEDYEQWIRYKKEKLERKKGCEYCDFSSNDVGATINTMGDDFVMITNSEDKSITLATDDTHFKTLKINFCPMCGRKLGE